MLSVENWAEIRRLHRAERMRLIPTQVWQPAYDSDGDVRDGAWVAELTGLLDLSGWPPGMRVDHARGASAPRSAAARHPRRRAAGDRLRHQHRSRPARRPRAAHRRRARCEDRIRVAKDTGLTNLPLHDLDQNKICCAVVSLACEITAWLQILALVGERARRWEPKRLRLRLFSAAGRLATSGRRAILHLTKTGRWTELLLSILTRLQALPAPSG